MNNKYFEILGRLDGVTPDDYVQRQSWMQTFLTIRRLAMKHNRLAEMDCNGEGYVNGRFYRCDGSTPGAYVDDDTTIFTAVSDKIEKRIFDLAASIHLLASFQGDPRGYTVKLENARCEQVDLCF